ncbi:unnamed protein product [Allacma fusca]|uniref:Uncharacterized protein n=1 Tax=Allacma fusca TaxID=39272 RepID=A0A8J2JXR8_9HEXA|nr:unnamed protein product [Allacma fusca]
MKSRTSPDVSNTCPYIWKGSNCGKPINPQSGVIFISAGINKLLEVGQYVQHVERNRPAAETTLIQDIEKLNKRFEKQIDEQSKINGMLINLFGQMALKTSELIQVHQSQPIEKM